MLPGEGAVRDGGGLGANTIMLLVCIYIYTYTHVCVYIDVHGYINAYIHTLIMYRHTYIHTIHTIHTIHAIHTIH